MKCSVCGCENEDSVAICIECGASLTPPVQTVTCCHCGKQIRTTAKYCVYCGAKRTDFPTPCAPLAAPAVEAPAEAPPIEEIPVAAEAPVEQPEPATAPAPVEAPASAEAPAPVAAPIFVPVAAYPIAAPAYQLPTGRGFWKRFFLGILTGMLYPLVILSRISMEINMVASRYDGKRTIHFLWLPLFSAITLGIYPLVWFHNLCNRIGYELRRRNICYRFSADAFWGWNFLWAILGSLLTAALSAILLEMQLLHGVYAALVICAGTILSIIGPCIFVGKLMRATNLMNADYNEKG